MSEPKRRRRGPNRTDGEKLEALTVRLPAKLKTALDMLARLQGRSLSQSVEWALQHALANVRGVIQDDSGSLWDLVQSAWDLQGWERTYFLYLLNQQLITFEERHACRLVSTSVEQEFIDEMQCSGAVKNLHKVKAGWSRVVAWMWPKLLDDATAMRINPRERLPLTAKVGALPPAYWKQPIPETIERAEQMLANLEETGITYESKRVIRPKVSPPR